MRLKLAIILAALSLDASAACFIVDSDGTKWIRPEINKATGKLQTTLGYFSAAKSCPEKIGLRVEESVAKAGCLRSSLATCDGWGGVKLRPNPLIPAVDNQCLFFRVASGTTEAGDLYYDTLDVYSGTTINVDTGVVTCKPAKVN